MTASLEFYDAAYPPDNPPPGADGVCGYIGGDATHVWSPADWASQPARYRVPIFVRSDPPGPGAAADVAAALAQLAAIGAPEGIVVAWDMETAVDAAYIKQVHTLLDGRYRLLVYGSQSTVQGNQNPDGLYWGADWTGVAHLAHGDVMTQWASDAEYDLSDAEDGVPFWDTKPTAKPPVFQYSPAQDQEGSMLLLPKGTPTPIAIPDGASRIRFTTVFGETGSFPAAKLSLNWHGNYAVETVTVDPHGVWPVVAIPAGVEGACVYREDDGAHYVSAAIY